MNCCCSYTRRRIRAASASSGSTVVVTAMVVVVGASVVVTAIVVVAASVVVGADASVVAGVGVTLASVAGTTAVVVVASRADASSLAPEQEEAVTPTTAIKPMTQYPIVSTLTRVDSRVLPMDEITSRSGLVWVGRSPDRPERRCVRHCADLSPVQKPLRCGEKVGGIYGRNADRVAVGGGGGIAPPPHVGSPNTERRNERAPTRWATDSPSDRPRAISSVRWRSSSVAVGLLTGAPLPRCGAPVGSPWRRRT